MKQNQVPKTCKTCTHRGGLPLFRRCEASGLLTSTERQFPSVCGKDFDAWRPKQGVLIRIKQFFVGADTEGEVK